RPDPARPDHAPAGRRGGPARAAEAGPARPRGGHEWAFGAGRRRRAGRPGSVGLPAQAVPPARPDRRAAPPPSRRAVPCRVAVGRAASLPLLVERRFLPWRVGGRLRTMNRDAWPRAIGIPLPL